MCVTLRIVEAMVVKVQYIVHTKLSCTQGLTYFHIYTGKIPFPSARDAKVIKDVLQSIRPPREMETTASRGLDDKMWLHISLWWDSMPSRRFDNPPRIWVAEQSVSAVEVWISLRANHTKPGRLSKLPEVSGIFSVSRDLSR
jgi:hypothetical protein